MGWGGEVPAPMLNPKRSQLVAAPMDLRRASIPRGDPVGVGAEEGCDLARSPVHRILSLVV